MIVADKTSGLNQEENFQLNEDSDEEDEEQVNKKIKNKRKRKKKKNNKKHVNNQIETRLEDDENIANEVEIEYVPEEIDIENNRHFADFRRVFDHFKLSGEISDKSREALVFGNQSKTGEVERMKYNILAVLDEESEKKAKKEENEAVNTPKLSKKKLKKATRLSVAELKQLVNRPDVVEMQDVTARDPKLLVHLKSTRNTVAVPRHWCAKRKYLQGKRGFEKPPFELPDFIRRTGITEMRSALSEKEDKKNLKQKMREKIRPKMGKIDIDYQKLHDAFFRWQTKPKMSIHGDLYYEGKEFETRLREKKPGNLTDDLRISLGMPTGINADKVPPPWLIAMQRYGPPPSYPNLKIPGLNAPIPDNCSFGYHAGGWGKPPVDEFGRPLYGDVFGATMANQRKLDEDDNVERSYWGQMETEDLGELPYEDSSDEEQQQEGGEGGEEEDMESQQQPNVASGIKTPGEGLITPSGLSTNVSAGLETPDMIELRKKKIESDMDDNETPVLYKVLPEKPVNVGSSMMGSSKVYDLSAAKRVAGESTDIDVALNPDELDLDSDTIQARYNQKLKEQHSAGGDKDDLGEMVSDHAVKQNKKRKKQQEQPTVKDSEKDKASKKKEKEFKF